MKRTQLKQRGGFTLTELMIAVVVLVIVLLATNKIFSTASKVTSLGQATTDIMQEAAAIERLIRADFAALAPEGFFAIRCVAAPNDVNVPNGPLLNPDLPVDAIIRSDQLVFFINSFEATQVYSQGAGAFHKGEASIARVYYGHAFQLPDGLAFDQGSQRAHDPVPADAMYPWRLNPQITMQRTKIGTPGQSVGQNEFSGTTAGVISARQPEARQWLLVRQPVILVDDDIQPPSAWNKTLFFYDNDPLTDAGNRSSKSIFIFDPIIGEPTQQIRDGRMDAAATMINDIRNTIQYQDDGDNIIDDWNIQRNFISSNAVYYPRAERVAPSSHPVDQALTNHVLGVACSSFIVDWTYDDFVGYPHDPEGYILTDNGGLPIADGVRIDPRREQPWFGFPDPNFVDIGQPARGVGTYRAYAAQFLGDPNRFTIKPEAVEPFALVTTMPGFSGFRYEAMFGFNQNRPLDFSDPSFPDGKPWEADSPNAYTPWPSGIRITMVLHDRDTKLESGREFQFVIKLPRRGE